MYDVNSSSLTISEVALVTSRRAQVVVGHRRRRPRAAAAQRRSRPGARRTGRAGSAASSSATSGSLAGIGVHRRQPPHAVLLGDVDQAEVGEERHAQPAEPLEALGIVERQREHRARLGVEALHLLGAPPRLDLDLGGAEQPRDVEHDAGLRGDVGEQLLVVAREAIRPRCARGASRPRRRPARERTGHHDAAAQRRLDGRHDRVEGARRSASSPCRVVDADRRRRSSSAGASSGESTGTRDADRRFARAPGLRAHEEPSSGIVGVDARGTRPSSRPSACAPRR